MTALALDCMILSTPLGALLLGAKSAPNNWGAEENTMMKYVNKEVISDREAERFARNLCKNRAKFSSFDEALVFVWKIRTVVSDAEFGRMHREHLARLAREVQCDEKTKRDVPTVREVEAEVNV